MPDLNRLAIVDRTKLTEEKRIDQFYTSHQLSTPEFRIPHDTKRLAEEPRPWWFRDKTGDEDE